MKDPTTALPATPDRDAVVRAMNDVSPAVQACGGGQERGLAQICNVFRGTDGGASSTTWLAEQSDRFSPGVRECILRAARGARVPPFRDESFSVSYPFRLR